MNPPSILGLATGWPPHCYPQSEILAYLQPMFNHSRHAQIIFERAGVACRAMAADEAFYREERRTGERNERYIAEALPLGQATIERCLAAAGCGPEAVDDFIVVSCTGVDIPGLDLRLAGQLKMRPDVRRTCILGMGCYAAFPGLLRAREAVAAQPDRLALMLALELCSLHLQADNSMENIVVSALFGDGAAAALVGHPGGSLRPGRGPRLLDAATYCDYTSFDHMAFHLTDHGFQMRLSAYVPQILTARIEAFVDDLLGRNGLSRNDVRFWGVHPGGGKILDHVQSRLALTDADMEFSRAVLREHGNMSSPTILFVLEQIQRCGQPQAGDYGVLLAFGPGLTTEGALLQW
jgi:predicted naringenin-chalcone synthase